MEKLTEIELLKIELENERARVKHFQEVNNSLTKGIEAFQI